MKALFLVAALALVVLGQEDPVYQWVPPSYPCVWNLEVERSTLLTWTKTKYYFNGLFMRSAGYNYAGVLISDTVYRPDITYFNNETNKTYITKFTYSATNGCVHQDEYSANEIGAYENKTLQLLFTGDLAPLLEAENFTNKSSVKFRGVECDVYYDLDVDAYAIYVDQSTKKIHAIVRDSDIPDARTQYLFKYGDLALLEDFTFKKDYVYNCTKNDILEAPAKGTCAASAAKATIAVIVASLIATLISLF